MTRADTPGVLLTFPFVQDCENGEELAWIDGDPPGEFPAPRVLILPAGSEPAATIDDVPADGPGRDLLVQSSTSTTPQGADHHDHRGADHHGPAGDHDRPAPDHHGHHRQHAHHRRRRAR